MSFIDSTGQTIEAHSLGVQPIKSLSAVSALGAGTGLDGGVSRANAVATKKITTSSGVSAGSVVLEGSLDGTNFFTLGGPHRRCRCGRGRGCRCGCRGLLWVGPGKPWRGWLGGAWSGGGADARWARRYSTMRSPPRDTTTVLASASRPLPAPGVRPTRVGRLS
jgi:hypothetical protein